MLKFYNFQTKVLRTERSMLLTHSLLMLGRIFPPHAVFAGCKIMAHGQEIRKSMNRRFFAKFMSYLKESSSSKFRISGRISYGRMVFDGSVPLTYKA